MRGQWLGIRLGAHVSVSRAERTFGGSVQTSKLLLNGPRLVGYLHTERIYLPSDGVTYNLAQKDVSNPRVR